MSRGEPWHLIVHEDLLIFRAPVKCSSSGILKPVAGNRMPPSRFPARGAAVPESLAA
jgi:hypothetical protein